MEGFDQARQHPRRKRKAESQDNERLSKRLSLLNIGELRFIDLLIASYLFLHFFSLLFMPDPVIQCSAINQSIQRACHPPRINRRGMIS